MGLKFCTLESAHLGPRHGRAQIGVFTGAFNNAAPTRIARNIHHGSEGPLDAGRTRILGRHPLGMFFDRRVPGGSHRQRDRKDGAIAVDYVKAYEQGNVQARPVNGHMLHPVDLLSVDLPQNRSDLSLCDGFVGNLFYRARHSYARSLVKLPCLFLYCHLAEKGVRTCVDVRVG